MAKILKCKPCGSTSPYWDWVGEKGYVEGIHDVHLIEAVAKGDPDILPFVESRPSSDLLDAILEVLDDGGEQVLTPRQREAFQLIVREGVSYRETARKMHVSIHAIQDLVQAGAKKLRVLSLTK
jgi:DNA-directed RNA polymerase specialized sigma24 family protein